MWFWQEIAIIGRSDSESIFKQQFGEYYSWYILTAAQSSGSQEYYKISGMTMLGLAGVLFWEKRAGIDKMDYRIFQKKYLFGC